MTRTVFLSCPPPRAQAIVPLGHGAETALLRDIVDMKSEGKVGVEDDSQDLVVSLPREWVTLKENARVDVRLMGVRREKDGVCFCERDGQ